MMISCHLIIVFNLLFSYVFYHIDSLNFPPANFNCKNNIKQAFTPLHPRDCFENHS